MNSRRDKCEGKERPSTLLPIYIIWVGMNY